MKSKRFAQYVCAAILAFGFGLNIQNALTGYGISDGSTSITAGDDTNSGSNGSTNGSTNGSSNGSSNCCSNGCSNGCSNCCSNGCSNCCSNGHCSNGSTSTRYYRDHVVCVYYEYQEKLTNPGESPLPGDYSEEWMVKERSQYTWTWARNVKKNGQKGVCLPLENGFYTSIEECETDFDTNCKG